MYKVLKGDRFLRVPSKWNMCSTVGRPECVARIQDLLREPRARFTVTLTRLFISNYCISATKKCSSILLKNMLFCYIKFYLIKHKNF